MRDETRYLLPFALLALTPAAALAAGCAVDRGSECSPGAQECVSLTHIRTCTGDGEWAEAYCGEPQFAPAGFACSGEPAHEHGCADDRCWWGCDEPACEEAENQCLDEATVLWCVNPQNPPDGEEGGMEAFSCDAFLAVHGEECACGGRCEDPGPVADWNPSGGPGCVCQCPGGCTDPPSADPTCACCGPDAGTADPDAGA